MTEKKKRCEDCFEYMPLGCGMHGDCNETGLIVPSNGNCFSWHKDHIEIPEVKDDDFLSKSDRERMSLWNI
jgi:hypothetical protein